MRRTILASLMLGLAMITGCDGAINSEYQEQLVVTGYLFAGEAVDSIVIHRTTPFGDVLDDQSTAIDNAIVTMTVDGVTHTLHPSTMRGRYYLSKSELTVEGGKTYLLQVAHNGQLAQSSTTVPMPIHYIGLDDSLKSRVIVFDTSNLSTFNYGLTAGPIDEPNRKYMLEVTANDTSAGRISTSIDGPPVDSNSISRFSFLQTAPSIRISPRLFGWFGANRLTFIAVDTNWVDDRRQNIGTHSTYQSSLSHVTGGYGTFASGARDTVTIWLKPR